MYGLNLHDVINEWPHPIFQAEDEESCIWMENILDGLRLCRRHCREAMNVSTALAIVNMAVMQKDASHTLETMKHRLETVAIVRYSNGRFVSNCQMVV